MNNFFFLSIYPYYYNQDFPFFPTLHDYSLPPHPFPLLHCTSLSVASVYLQASPWYTQLINVGSLVSFTILPYVGVIDATGGLKGKMATTVARGGYLALHKLLNNSAASI